MLTDSSVISLCFTHLLYSLRCAMLQGPKQSLCEGHCMIVPTEHLPSTRVADDNTLIDIRNFKKSLVRMFAAQGKQVLFMELAKGLERSRTHAAIEVVPIPRTSQPELYFRQAFEHASSEWDTNRAKRCLATGKSGLSDKIPPGFPYFHVEVGMDRGMLHVLGQDENEYVGIPTLSLLLSPSLSPTLSTFDE